MANVDPVARWLSSRICAQRTLPAEILKADLVSKAITAIATRWPQSEDPAVDLERPVFVLSSAWGSGSTLLQRLVVSSGRIMVWGEPVDHAAPIHRLTQMLMPVSATWPRQEYFEFPGAGAGLSEAWIANLTPPMDNLRSAMRSFLLRWLKSPAVEKGYGFWGLKEVRLTVHHARFLRWLFPNARFLLIYRDVMDAFRSCRRVNWLSIWPDYKVDDVVYFAHHWRALLEGFLEDAEATGGILIRYEDLVTGKTDLDAIRRYLDIGDIDDNVLKMRVGARGKSKPALSRKEKYLINCIAGKLRRSLGYSDVS